MEKQPTVTLGVIAQIIGAELKGPVDLPIHRPVSAGSDDPTGITFAGDEKHLSKALASTVGAVILSPEAALPDRPCLVHPQPKIAFGMVLAFFEKPLSLNQGIHPSAVIDPTAEVDPTAFVGPNVVIGKNAKICAGAKVHALCFVGDRSQLGEGSVLFPRVTLYHDVFVGSRCAIHSGTVVGSDGFGYVWDGKAQRKIPQVGRVIIEDHVEIGSNTCIDRGTFEDTVLEAGVKIDNLVQIAHNCRIGAHSVLAGQTGMGGSTTLGKGCVLAGQAGIGDHTTLEDGTVLTGQTGVQGHVEKNVYAGSPGQPFKAALRTLSATRRLPDLEKKVKELEAKLTALIEAKEA